MRTPRGRRPLRDSVPRDKRACDALGACRAVMACLPAPRLCSDGCSLPHPAHGRGAMGAFDDLIKALADSPKGMMGMWSEGALFQIVTT